LTIGKGLRVKPAMTELWLCPDFRLAFTSEASRPEKVDGLNNKSGYTFAQGLAVEPIL
jgi:hypothetical protein